MSEPINFEGCLYFSANSLSRHLNEIAEEAFKVTEIAPGYAYVMLYILDKPGLSQQEIAKKMNLKASTVTRFIEKLMTKGFVVKEQAGRKTCIYPTPAAENHKPFIEQALSIMYAAYTDLLGEELVEKLTNDIQQVNQMLT